MQALRHDRSATGTAIVNVDMGYRLRRWDAEAVRSAVRFFLAVPGWSYHGTLGGITLPGCITTSKGSCLNDAIDTVRR